MKKIAEKVLGKVRTQKHSWMTNELLDLCYKRRRLKSINNTSTENAQEYRKIEIMYERNERKLDIEIMFIYRPGYTKWYTLKTCLSNTQSPHKFEHEEENLSD